MRQLQSVAAAETRGLLRVLLLRIGEMSAHAGTTPMLPGISMFAGLWLGKKI
jgi:hypothetical protein